MKYQLTLLAEDTPGVLSHIVSLISRRSFNINTLSVGYTEEEHVTRMSFVLTADSENEVEQVIKQINKLINVIKIVNLTHIDSINRELVMIKVKADPITRNDIVNIVNIFRAKIVDINRETLVIELTGDHTKIDALCEMLADYEVIEVARTGTLTMSRGPIPVKNM